MQTYDQSDIGDTTIRSSKLKCFEGCTYLFYTSYFLGVPQKKNSGSEKGQICHDLLEILGKPKHRHVYDIIFKGNSAFIYKPIIRLIKRYIKNSETLKDDKETLDHINLMLLTGIKNDFFVDGGKIVAHEYKFEITSKDPYYKIKGFMDKVAIRDDCVIIHDYKGSKRVYVGEDKESNVQAMIYSLVAKKLWPNKKVKVIFIFLAHPDNPLLEAEFTDETLNGFSHYLADRQKQFDNFTIKRALDNMAADKPRPPDKSFGGILLCGYGKHPNHIKPSTGEPYWVCPSKWSTDYFIVKKDGKTQYSTLDSTKIKLKEGEIVEKAHYNGCPRYVKSNILNDFNIAPKAKFDPLEGF